MTIKIRPSDLLAFENCGKAYQFRKEGWWPDSPSANLAFGTAMHSVIESVLKGECENPVMAFDYHWDKALAESPMRFSAKTDEPTMRTFGHQLSLGFSESWKATGMQVAIDPSTDALLMEKRLEVEVVPGVILTAQFDALAWTPDGELAVVDFKTASNQAPNGFVDASDQLTAYQIVVDAHRQKLGLPMVGRLGFLEGIKRKTTGKWIPSFSCRRSEDRIQEYIDKVTWMASEIKAGRTFRRARMAWNTPCKTCDFINLCLNDSTDGLSCKTDRKIGEREMTEWF
jgi:hypothetical protein